MAPKDTAASEKEKNVGIAKAGRNKKLEEKIRKQKEDREAAAGAVDPKNKGKAPPAKEVKKEDPKAAGKAVKKTQQQIEEEEAEEERLKLEAEQAEKARIEALERAFDKEAVFKSMGGRVTNFEIEREHARTQHYDWLLPVYFRSMDQQAADAGVKTVFLEVRTTTVPKTLVPNTSVLEFGEIPVAFKKTQEILIKNVGVMEETLRL